MPKTTSKNADSLTTVRDFSMSLAFDSMLLLITTVECVVNDNNGIRLTYPHGMCTTHADVINSDLLAFIRS
jgi:hypothetical protein